MYWNRLLEASADTLGLNWIRITHFRPSASFDYNQRGNASETSFRPIAGIWELRHKLLHLNEEIISKTTETIVTGQVQSRSEAEKKSQAWHQIWLIFASIQPKLDE